MILKKFDLRRINSKEFLVNPPLTKNSTNKDSFIICTGKQFPINRWGKKFIICKPGAVYVNEILYLACILKITKLYSFVPTLDHE